MSALGADFAPGRVSDLRSDSLLGASRFPYKKPVKGCCVTIVEQSAVWGLGLVVGGLLTAAGWTERKREESRPGFMITFWSRSS
jgi:hypothetical protein